MKYKNVLLLMLSQGCFNAANMTMMAFASLAGAILADDVAYATMPVATGIVSNALSTFPMSMFMGRFGRKAGFRLGAFLGTTGGLLAAYSVYIGSFAMLVGSFAFVGPFLASAQYYRFAAGESVAKDYVPRAISFVLIGGLGAALIVPTAAAYFNEMFQPYNMMGPFVFLALAAFLAFGPIQLYRESRFEFDEGSAGQEDLGDTLDEKPRDLKEIIGQRGFFVAVLNAAMGYGMMTGVMTATPLAMQACGFTPYTSSTVIQTHVIAMYLPSLFTGIIIERIGLVPVLLMGQALFVAAFSTTLSGIALTNFSVGLIFLGVGWNFCFIGGTTLLTRLHRPCERGKVQGLNEFLVFGMSAGASFASGFVLRYLGWDSLNLGAFILLAVACFVTLRYAAGGLFKVKDIAAE